MPSDNAKSDLVSVRTSFQPEVELEVSPGEAVSLDRQGLLVHTRAETPAGARRAAEAMPANQGIIKEEK